MFRNVLILAFLAVTVLSIIPSHFQFRQKLNKVNNLQGNDDISVISAFTTQYLDHFTGNVSGNFSQRYYYSQHFTLHQKTAFLYVSELGTFEKDVITDDRNPIVKAAKQFGATLFSLEHRYYGLSKPNFEKFDAFNLRYLNSYQAIMDIISFIKYANVQFNLDPDVRWVLWGAGYGGILAAEARKWDPVSISGVIASSSPLVHKYDFWDYNDHVEDILYQKGNSTCHSKVKQGFSDIRNAMRTPEGRANVSALFNLDPTLDNTNLNYNDIQMFYLAIISPFQEIVQFNNDFNLSISDLCTTIENSNWTNMEVVYQAYVYVSTTLTGSVQPMQISYQNYVTQLADTSPSSSAIDYRMWQYQICTEFAWFYTTNSHENALFGAVVPSSLFLNQCFDIFPDAQLTATSIRDLTIDYNNFYGAAYDYAGTNAVFTNGMFDPWSQLGKESTGDFSVVTYMIPDASYASDFFPGDTTNAGIIQAHNIMLTNIDTWVNGARNTRVLVNTTNPWIRPVWGEFGSIGQQNSRFSVLTEDVPSKKTYPKENKFKRVLHGRPPHGFVPDVEMAKDASYPPGFEQGTFRQRVDHFDNTNTDTFQQKYFKNSQWAKTGGPNFLMIGGEGPESASWVLHENITYLKYAQKYGATVYLLEHRFYGDSIVGEKNDDFSKLSSLQMLYDLAEFIRSVNYKTGSSAPWITFGGSYSGAMSAWMREVFPDLVIGAVASSGPVFAKTDFYEYLIVVENAIRTYSPDCATNIQTGFDTIRQLFLTREGRQNLTDLFQLYPSFGDNVTDIDQHYFFSNLYGNFQGAVQYSGDNAGYYAYGYGIPDMCRIMTNSSYSPLQNIAQFNEFMSVFYNGGGEYTGMDNDFQNLVSYLKNAQLFGPEAGASLLWTWQTCTEFGYFQSADSGNGIFGSPAPVNLDIEMCKQVFGPFYDRQTIDRQIDYTNYVYGERFHFRGSNVIFPNGNVDPWHALGLYYPTDKTVVSYLINGTAHCADMYPARDEDVPDLKVVRDLIDQNIASWLNQANGQTSTTTTTTGTSTVTSATGTSGSPASPISTTTVRTTTQSASSATIVLSILVSFIIRYIM